MWRPLEVFLYDWWPIRAEARLGDPSSAMPVRIVHKAETSSEASGARIDRNNPPQPIIAGFIALRAFTVRLRSLDH